MAYQPIENYGIIGNMRTSALVGRDGSIDWLCFPHFDSPSVFAAILDDKKGGRFSIAPCQTQTTTKQFYWPDTNVLVTRFLSREGVGEIEDFMPVSTHTGPDLVHQLVRRVKVVRGQVTFRLECRPAFDYARTPHETHLSSSGAVFSTPALTLGLATTLPLKQDEQGVFAEFTLQRGEHAVCVLREIGEGERCGAILPEGHAETVFQCTIEFWHEWLSHSRYTGRWREMVSRSALVLKLLTYEPTGAIVAAPTCGLPEEIGGVRNWDYRYTWIRDSAFTLYGFLRIGFTREATAFMNWLDTRVRNECDAPGPLQIVYGIDGRTDLTEHILDHLDGYKGSRPVRIGNDAYRHLQLDIYGELLDSIYLYDKGVTPISYRSWGHVRDSLEWLCDNWTREDEGIWEVRGGRRHFVYSKLMCWVALDRGLRLSHKRSLPADHLKWLTTRDCIYEDIMTKGWNEARGSFVQSYGSDSLDASNLIMPLVRFISPTDSRMLKTLAAINRPPAEHGLVSDGLVYRYDAAKGTDGLDGSEGTFNMCSFWLVEALTRAGRSDRRKLEEARLLFERMLGYANHLGLYAEETGDSGEALGNFPQAFTHLALISSAFNLDRALNGD
ncbi:MAG: glycoside hydrolase family 15 protein [Nitrospira sp.]|nr:glycoside hydrolase family 15 protein [Nitrospira sp.]